MARLLPLCGIAACLLLPTPVLSQTTAQPPQPPAGHAVTVPLRPLAEPSAIDKALSKPTILNPGETAKEQPAKPAPTEATQVPATQAPARAPTTRTVTNPEARKEAQSTAPAPAASPAPAPSAAPAPIRAEAAPVKPDQKPDPVTKPTAPAAAANPVVTQAKSRPAAPTPETKSVGTEQAADAKVADIKPKPKPTTVSVRVDLSHQQAHVSIEGKPTYVWPISSGRAGYETPTGNFRAQWMSKLWFSKKYDDAPMPHSVFFNDGIAFHGTTSVRLLGKPASHGCIRLAPSNAATLFNLVQKHGVTATRVVVEGKTPVMIASKRDTPEGMQRPARGPREYGYPPRGGYANAPGYPYGYPPPGYYPQPRMVWPGDAPWGWGGGRRDPRAANGYPRGYY